MIEFPRSFWSPSRQSLSVESPHYNQPRSCSCQSSRRSMVRCTCAMTAAIAGIHMQVSACLPSLFTIFGSSFSLASLNAMVFCHPLIDNLSVAPWYECENECADTLGKGRRSWCEVEEDLVGVGGQAVVEVEEGMGDCRSRRRQRKQPGGR